MKDENNHEPTVQARQLGVNGRQKVRHQPRMTPVEIGMYVLLAAFCFAIVVCHYLLISYIQCSVKFQMTQLFLDIRCVVRSLCI